MNIEHEINNIKQSIQNIMNDITELKEKLCFNKMIRPEDFFSDTDKFDLLNKRKYVCLICSKIKDKECFKDYNETGKGICLECYNTNFPGE